MFFLPKEIYFLLLSNFPFYELSDPLFSICMLHVFFLDLQLIWTLNTRHVDYLEPGQFLFRKMKKVFRKNKKRSDKIIKIVFMKFLFKINKFCIMCIYGDRTIHRKENLIELKNCVLLVEKIFVEKFLIEIHSIEFIFIDYKFHRKSLK